MLVKYHLMTVQVAIASVKQYMRCIITQILRTESAKVDNPIRLASTSEGDIKRSIPIEHLDKLSISRPRYSNYGG